MDPLDANTILGIALGLLVRDLLARLQRWVAKSRFWQRVFTRAQATLSDPNIPISDPQQAAEHALLETQRPSVEAVARKLSVSTPPENRVRDEAAGD